MDDEIFQGVSFAAVKEQLHLLGHDLPDDVILAYLTEGSAAAPTQSAPEEHSGRHCSIGEPDDTSRSSADYHSDLSAGPAKHWDRTSSESYSLRRSCIEEELLSALTLTEAECTCTLDGMPEERDGARSSREHADATAVLRVSARCVLSPVAPRQKGSARRCHTGAVQLDLGVQGPNATVAARTRGGAVRLGLEPCHKPYSPPGHMGGATGILSPPHAGGAAGPYPALNLNRLGQRRPADCADAPVGPGTEACCSHRADCNTARRPPTPAEPRAGLHDGLDDGSLAAHEAATQSQHAPEGARCHGLCAANLAADVGAPLWVDSAPVDINRDSEEGDMSPGFDRSCRQPWAARAPIEAGRGEGEEDMVRQRGCARRQPRTVSPAADGGEAPWAASAATDAAVSYSDRGTGEEATHGVAWGVPAMASLEYYDLPRSLRRPPPPRGRAGAAAPNDFAREPCEVNYAVDCSATDIDKAYDLYGPAGGARGGRSPERRPQSAATARRSDSSAQPRSASRSAGGAGCHGGGLSAHDAARNRAVLAAAALKPPRVDRVARYQELKRIWDSDPFLRAGGGGANPTAHRPPAGFREAFEAAHAAAAEERAYWARVYAAGGCAGGEGRWCE